MIIFIFALIDIFAAIMMLAVRFSPAVNLLALVSAFFLFLKSIFFIGDFASWVDLLAVFFILIAVIGINSIFAYVLIIWLFQKGLRSLF